MIRTGRFARTTVVVLLLGVVLLLFSSAALAAGACYLVTTTMTQDENGKITSTTTVTPIPCPPAPIKPREPMDVGHTDATPNGVSPDPAELGRIVACDLLQSDDPEIVASALDTLGVDTLEEGLELCGG